MSAWKSYLNKDPSDWLLEHSHSSVCYFSLRWLQDLPEDHPLVEEAGQELAASSAVQKILRHQRPEGYWGSDARPHHGTHKQLMLLMWLGFRGDAGVRQAMDYRLDGVLQADGAYGVPIKGRVVLVPCHAAVLLRQMIWFGYGQDPRALRLLAWLLHVQEQDGAWPCISKRKPFPCLWATADVLRAYRDLPDHLVTPQVAAPRRQAVSLFLESGLYRQKTGKVSPRWFEFGFPLQWDTDVLELLAPHVSPAEPRIQDGLALVLAKQDADGRWPCEKSPKGGRWIDKYVPLEAIGKPSRWVTLHALKMLKTLFRGRPVEAPAAV